MKFVYMARKLIWITIIFYGLVHAVISRQARPIYLRGLSLQLLDVPGTGSEGTPWVAATLTKQLNHLKLCLWLLPPVRHLAEDQPKRRQAGTGMDVGHALHLQHPHHQAQQLQHLQGYHCLQDCRDASSNYLIIKIVNLDFQNESDILNMSYQYINKFLMPILGLYKTEV